MGYCCISTVNFWTQDTSIEDLLNSIFDENDVNTSSNNKNYKDSLLFTLKGASHSNIFGKTIDNLSNNISFGSNFRTNLRMNYDSFMSTFFNIIENNKYLFFLLSFLNSNNLFKFFSINKNLM